MKGFLKNCIFNDFPLVDSLINSRSNDLGSFGERREDVQI
jgi:hypothetical protein